uniref:Non-imprinted in Prader-Willi/Angelman syndrome region protein 2 n=1 Tax=Pyricularia oryzae (strain P131) TaxID=1143193 RepID=L7IS69_PYRO1
MDATTEAMATAHELYARSGGIGGGDAASRPPIFKLVGIILAISSGAFIGTSFVLKKYGLLKANEKYNEEPGEGYGYLKNFWWWTGMILMIIGEICNFVAYAFTDAILVTPLGALSVVITAILSAIFLKERLSLVGKVSCFLCIVGSVVIVMNGPQESSVATIEQMQSFVIHPAFLSYTGVIVIGSAITAFYCGPRWGKKNMLVYISICSWIGGLSVVATQGLGAAIVTQIGGKPQFNQWFTYVLLAFVIATLLTEIIFLNKALNLFNAAMVTPTYYVYFTSTTIITSTVLFRGFKGTPTSIITVVLGFLTICAGVVLLQLSKSAKDVPDTAVFNGDLDQIHTIAEQEQPETEPKADAIRGTAAIVRRLSSARMRMEAEELKRLHEEKQAETLDPVNEDAMAQYEWDGLRRRRTTYGSRRSRAMTSPNPFGQKHNGEGWGYSGKAQRRGPGLESIHSPMHPVQLTEVNLQQTGQDLEAGLYPEKKDGKYYQGSTLSVPGTSRSAPAGRHRGPSNASDLSSLGPPPTPPPHGGARRQFSFQKMGFGLGMRGSGASQHQASPSPGGFGSDGIEEARPRTGRGYSSPITKGASEEERVGLVTNDVKSLPTLPRYDEVSEENELLPEEGGAYSDESRRTPPRAKYGRGITESPPRARQTLEEAEEASLAEYEASRKRFNDTRAASRDRSGDPGSSRDRGSPPARQSRRPPPGGNNGAFI